MVSKIAALLLSLAPFALGQSNELAIEAIEAQFTQSGLVPALLATFNPSALLTASFAAIGNFTSGQTLPQNQVQSPPNILITPANSSVQLGGNFTLMMVDAAFPGADESQGQVRHWLTNDITLSGSPPDLTLATSAAIPITEYFGPAPPPGSGVHRYVIMLFSQPSTFVAPPGLNTANVGAQVGWDFNEYVKDSGLGPLVAANYFIVTNGTATFTASPTSPVITSTLPAASATDGVSNGSNGSGSQGSSPSATSPASGAKASNAAVSIGGSEAYSAVLFTAVISGLGAILL